MSPPIVRVNTFVQNDESFIDPLSKYFVIGETVLGLNRLRVFGNIKTFYVILAFIHALFLVCLIMLGTFYFGQPYYEIANVMNIIEYIFIITFSFTSWKRMHRYFIELNKFDREVGCRPKNSRGSISNIIQMCILIVFIFFLFVLPYKHMPLEQLMIQLLPVHLIHNIELHFYGHLLNLLTPRIRLLNHYMASSLSNVKGAITRPKKEEFDYFKSNDHINSLGNVKKLMGFYYIIKNAYDLLIDAIKWQLLVIITSSFVSILCFSYEVSLSVIRGSKPLLTVLSDTGIAAALMVPLFAPCVFSDWVHGEVHRLRELLASRLYENKLDSCGFCLRIWTTPYTLGVVKDDLGYTAHFSDFDKSSRSVARALLALTETRNLSFSLLRMLDIDISLPFKFLGLLITYLIILLQFEKVINP